MGTTQAQMLVSAAKRVGVGGGVLARQEHCGELAAAWAEQTEAETLLQGTSLRPATQVCSIYYTRFCDLDPASLGWLNQQGPRCRAAAHGARRSASRPRRGGAGIFKSRPLLVLWSNLTASQQDLQLQKAAKREWRWAGAARAGAAGAEHAGAIKRGSVTFLGSPHGRQFPRGPRLTGSVAAHRGQRAHRVWAGGYAPGLPAGAASPHYPPPPPPPPAPPPAASCCLTAAPLCLPAGQRQGCPCHSGLHRPAQHLGSAARPPQPAALVSRSACRARDVAMLLLCAYCRRGLGSNMLMPFLCKRRRRPDGKWRKQKAGSKAYAFGGWAAFAAGNIMRFIAMRFAAQTVLSGLGSLQVGALNVPVWACRSRMLPPLHLRTVLRCLRLSQEQAAVSCAAQPASQPHSLPPACPQFVIIPIASRFMLGIRASTSTVVGVTIVLLGEMLLQCCCQEGAA